MGYLGEDVKKLGFGLMRLPKIGDEFDIEQIKKMVDAFIAAGGTYFDTAFVYQGSEEAIKKALVERYPRDAYTLATKNAAWVAATKEEAEAQFTTSLERTGAGYFDFYLLHKIGPTRTEVFENWDMWSFIKQKKAEGLIKHIGFSFHDGPEALEEVINAHPEAEFVQMQINYADWEDRNIQSRKNYEVARKHNLPVIIMEPVKGGMLANPPQPVLDVFKKAEPEMSAASWALRFAANLDGLITVLSGMSSMEQMEDNLKTMENFTKFTPEQEKTVEEALEALRSIPIIQCTSCNYCAKVCPMNIGISGLFACRNHYTLYNDKAAALHRMKFDVERYGKGTASQCIQCGSCESVCPQMLPIPELLTEIAEVFGK